MKRVFHWREKQKRDSLLGRHLAHVDPDTDHLPGLHAGGAGPGAPGAQRGVEGGDGGVLGAGAPGPRLPVVDGAGVLVAVADLLQGAAVGAQGAAWSRQDGVISADE